MIGNMPHGRPIPSRRAWLWIAVAACAVYANTFVNGLVYDDRVVLPAEPMLQQPWNLPGIFGGVYRIGDRVIGADYRPLTVWTFALNHRMNEWMGLPGLDPRLFHFANILLHAGACAAFLSLLLALGASRFASLTAALIFAVHPIHTEAVAGVVGRSEILGVLFGLLFLLSHRLGRAPGISALCLLLAMWGKESAITFLPLAILMDQLFQPPGRDLPWRAWGVFSATAAGWLLLWWIVLRHESKQFAFVDNPLISLPAVDRVLTALTIHLHYLWLQLVPVGLSSDYSYHQIPLITDPSDGHVLLVVLVGALGLLAAWLWRRSDPLAVFGILGYPVLFAVTGNILLPIGSTAERHVYAPSLMACLLLARLAERGERRAGRAVRAVVAAILLAYAGLTVARNETWNNELVFFREQVRSAPRSAKAHFNLGTVLAAQGDDRGATSEYETAVSIFPLYAEAYYNLGNALRRTHAPSDRVIGAYRQAILGDPGDIRARGNLALVLLDLGRPAEARPLVEEIGRINPAAPQLALLSRRLGGAGVKGALGGSGGGPGVIPSGDLQRGIGEYAAGHMAAAAALFEKTLSANQVSPTLRRTTLMMLSRAYEALGDHVRADQRRREAGALPPH